MRAEYGKLKNRVPVPRGMNYGIISDADLTGDREILIGQYIQQVIQHHFKVETHVLK